MLQIEKTIAQLQQLITALDQLVKEERIFTADSFEQIKLTANPDAIRYGHEQKICRIELIQPAQGLIAELGRVCGRQIEIVHPDELNRLLDEADTFCEALIDLETRARRAYKKKITLPQGFVRRFAKQDERVRTNQHLAKMLQFPQVRGRYHPKVQKFA